MPWSKILKYFSASLLMTSCSFTPPSTKLSIPQETDFAKHCIDYYVQLNKAISSAGVRDAQAVHIDGFPYLRLNRFYASFKNELSDPNKFDAWIEQLQQLAYSSYSIEINNLNSLQKSKLSKLVASALTDRGNLKELLNLCSKILAQQELQQEHNRTRLLLNSEVPDDYYTWQRAVGLYALTSIPFASGISNWHEESSTELKKPIDQLAVHGQLIRYTAPAKPKFTSYEAIQQEINAALENPLQIPMLSPELTQRLFATFSPVWEIDVVTEDDKIGSPYWTGEDNKAHIDTHQPSVYTLLSYARFADDILLQLNYIVWFPSRPCTSSMDLLCGHMDGIIWRVTIGTDGAPLVYDTIHNCGCYHTFFPTQKLEVIPYEPTIEEHAFTPITAPALDIDQQIVLRVSHRTHYIDGLYVTNLVSSSQKSLIKKKYSELRSLNTADGQRRSLFQEDGIVAGTQRGERWLFWPMGVASAGAMRQWGKHATAFVGRRHFDDPLLMQSYFRLR